MISVSKITVAIAVLVLIAAVALSGYEVGRNITNTNTNTALVAAPQFAKAQAAADAEYVLEQAYQNSTPSKISAAIIALNDHVAAVGGDVALVRLGSDDRAYFQVRINGVVGDVCIDYGGLSYGETPTTCRKQ